MFRVEYRFAGFGLWNAGISATSAQAAWGQARGMSTPQRSDEVRVVPAAPSQLLDLRV